MTDQPQTAQQDTLKSLAATNKRMRFALGKAEGRIHELEQLVDKINQQRLDNKDRYTNAIALADARIEIIDQLRTTVEALRTLVEQAYLEGRRTAGTDQRGHGTAWHASASRKNRDLALDGDPQHAEEDTSESPGQAVQS